LRMPPKRRSRSKSPARRVAQVTTKGGKTYEITEKPREKSAKQVEAAERRRSKDVIVEAVSGTLAPQGPGRPRKGQEGPKPGSLRHVQAATGGIVSRGQLQRGATQLAKSGKVRDQRKHNSSEANLTEGQLDAILGFMYDEFEQKKYVNYNKVISFAVQLQHDEAICAALDCEPCNGPDDCWTPSHGWMAGYLKKWRISSHKSQGKASSRSRPTMEGEEAWVDENYKRFAGWSVVTQDESSFIWGAPPYRTLATSDGLGAQLSVEDKWEKMRSTLVLAVRSVDKDEDVDQYAILTPLVIPSHDCLPKGKSQTSKRTCPLQLPQEHSGEWPCDCHKRAVRGVHECHWDYLLRDVWMGRADGSAPEMEEGDAWATDNLACHNNLKSRRLYLEKGINHLPLPPKVAPSRSILDNSFFAVLKTCWRQRMAARRERDGPLPPQFERAANIVEEEILAALEDCTHTIPAFSRHNKIFPNRKAKKIVPQRLQNLYRETGVKYARSRPLLPFGRPPSWYTAVKEKGLDDDEQPPDGMEEVGPRPGKMPRAEQADQEEWDEEGEMVRGEDDEGEEGWVEEDDEEDEGEEEDEDEEGSECEDCDEGEDENEDDEEDAPVRPTRSGAASGSGAAGSSTAPPASKKHLPFWKMEKLKEFFDSIHARDAGSAKQAASIRSRHYDSICEELDISEEFARTWRKQYNRGQFEAAFDSGEAQSGSGGRPKAKPTGRATQRDQRKGKEQRKAATRVDTVDVDDTGAGGIAARMRGRKQQGER